MDPTSSVIFIVAYVVYLAGAIWFWLSFAIDEGRHGTLRWSTPALGGILALLWPAVLVFFLLMRKASK